MGGDIAILDKEIGEKGTCFRFSVILTVSEGNINSGGNTRQSSPTSRLTFQAPSPSLHSPRAIQTTSSKPETSRVILLIRNDQRRMICKKFMESLGVKVLAMKQREQLLDTLQKILGKQSHSRHDSRGRSENSSPNDFLSKSTSGDSRNGMNMDVSLGAMKDETNYLLSVFKKTNLRCGISFILIVIDASAGPFREISNMVANFRRRLQGSYCKVVWLLENQMLWINHKGLETNDVVISRPFHGSRLYEVIRHLPEFGGTIQSREGSILCQGENVSKDSSSSLFQNHGKTKVGSSPILEGQIAMPLNQNYSRSVSKSRISWLAKNQETREDKSENLSGEKPLTGKKILVAEDNTVLQMIVTLTLSNLGATIEICENGEEALELVSNGLGNQLKHAASNTLPYDYILMDCEVRNYVPSIFWIRITTPTANIQRTYIYS